MKTRALCTTVLHPSTKASVEIVEPVGVEEQDTSSSSSTNIPQSILDIFKGQDPAKFVRAYYLNEASVILARGTWVFEGREKMYTQEVTSEAEGNCIEVCVVFKGRVKRMPNIGQPAHSNFVRGEACLINLPGVYIP